MQTNVSVAQRTDSTRRISTGLKLGSAFAALIIGATVGATIVGINGRDHRDDELFKFFLALIQVGGLGGIAAILLEWYKQTNATRQRLDEQYRQMFFEARKAYDTLKRTRRILRDRLKAKYVTPAQLGVLLADPQKATALVKLGRILFDPQLSLESLDEQAQNARDLPRAAELAKCFYALETNTHSVSDALRAAQAPGPGELAAISGFLAKDGFRRDFKEPYHHTITILLNRP